MSKNNKTFNFIKKLGHRYMANRFAVLFYFLLLTLVAMPLLALLGFQNNLLRLFLAFNLLMGVGGMNVGSKKNILLIFVAVFLAVEIIPEQFVNPIYSESTFIFWAVIALITSINALRFAILSEEKGIEHIYAALSAYLLAGIFLGATHWIVEHFWPGSYSGFTNIFTLNDAIYFSFITLTTLGYGDFVPKSELARALCVIEAVAGQLYITVMIAGLVNSTSKKVKI
jgi:voltage-gated potassium channel